MPSRSTGWTARWRSAAEPLRSGEHGFTLLETVIAFAILSITLGSLYSGYADALSREAAARSRWLAAEFARSRMEEIGMIVPIREGVVERRLKDVWTWETRITYAPKNPPDLFDLTLPLYDVTLRVRDAASGRELVTLKTTKIGSSLEGTR